MDEQTKVGYRKVLVTLIGQVMVLMALFAPAFAEKMTPYVSTFMQVGVPILIEIGVVLYNYMNVKQKVELAKIAKTTVAVVTAAGTVVDSAKGGQ